MKQLICEMCGSTDLIKQDGVFVCQNCNTKYSVEEAKKMMIEGNVDVSGSTVKIDVSEKLENLYQLARRAKEEDNEENAKKYYDMLTAERPNDWEAYFYSAYYRARTCKLIQIENEAAGLKNTIDTTFMLIKDNVDEEQWTYIYIEIISKIEYLVMEFITAAVKHYKENSSISSEYKTARSWSISAFSLLVHLGDAIYSEFSDAESAKTIYEFAMKIIESEKNNWLFEFKASLKERIINVAPDEKLNLHINDIDEEIKNLYSSISYRESSKREENRRILICGLIDLISGIFCALLCFLFHMAPPWWMTLLIVLFLGAGIAYLIWYNKLTKENDDALIHLNHKVADLKAEKKKLMKS